MRPGKCAHSDTCIKYVTDEQRKHDWDAFPQHQRERQDSELKSGSRSPSPPSRKILVHERGEQQDIAACNAARHCCA